MTDKAFWFVIGDGEDPGGVGGVQLTEWTSNYQGLTSLGNRDVYRVLYQSERLVLAEYIDSTALLMVLLRCE